MLHGTIGFLVNSILELITLLVFIYALLSWIPNLDRNNAIVKFIVNTGDTICAPVRKLIPPKNTGNIDLSPMIIILAIYALQMIL